jgi:glycerol-3-phosphate O-acyltransferase
MGIQCIILHLTRMQLFREVQREFNRLYPYLQLEFLFKPDNAWTNSCPDSGQRVQAIELLQQDIGLSDDMTVIELENALQEWFGIKIAVLRKDGPRWMSTHRTEDWTMKQHCVNGHDIDPGFQ